MLVCARTGNVAARSNLGGIRRRPYGRVEGARGAILAHLPHAFRALPVPQIRKIQKREAREDASQARGAASVPNALAVVGISYLIWRGGANRA